MSGAITVAKPSALAWIQPGRSTTSTGAVVLAATRPVNSRTSGVERSAPARSSSTASVASVRVTCGPSPTSRDPTRTARSQSIIPGRPEGPCALMGSTLRRRCTRPARPRCGRSSVCAASSLRGRTWSATTTNAIRPSLTSSTTPASPCTPVSVPVLARTLPRASAGPLSKRYCNEPVKPETGSPVSTCAQARLVGLSASRSTPASVSVAEPVRRESPLPSYSWSPVTGTPSRCSTSRTDALPAAKEPSCRSARPTWRASTSAAWLSLTSRVRSTISPSGALETDATSSASGGSDCAYDLRAHLQPVALQGRAEHLGRRRGRVGDDTRSRSGSWPWSTQSELIGGTTSSGM